MATAFEKLELIREAKKRSEAVRAQPVQQKLAVIREAKRAAVSTPTLDASGVTGAEVKRRAANGEPVVQEGLRAGTRGEQMGAIGIDALTGAAEGVGGALGFGVDAAVDMMTAGPVMRGAKAALSVVRGEKVDPDSLTTPMRATATATAAADDLRETLRKKTGLDDVEPGGLNVPLPFTDEELLIGGDAVRFAANVLTPGPEAVLAAREIGAGARTAAEAAESGVGVARDGASISGSARSLDDVWTEYQTARREADDAQKFITDAEERLGRVVSPEEATDPHFMMRMRTEIGGEPEILSPSAQVQTWKDAHAKWEEVAARKDLLERELDEVAARDAGVSADDVRGQAFGGGNRVVPDNVTPLRADEAALVQQAGDAQAAARERPAGVRAPETQEPDFVANELARKRDSTPSRTSTLHRPEDVIGENGTWQVDAAVRNELIGRDGVFGQLTADPGKDAVYAALPSGTRVLTSGTEAGIMLAPDGNVIRLSKSGTWEPRPNIPEVLQPVEVQHVGDWQIEVLPEVHPLNDLPAVNDFGRAPRPSAQASPEEIATLKDAIRSSGYELWDDKPANLGITNDGRLVVVDGGAVRRASGAHSVVDDGGPFGVPSNRQGGGGPPNVPADAASTPPTGSAVDRVIAGLREARPLERKQRGIYRETRGQRIAVARKAREDALAAGQTPREAFRAERSALKGEMRRVHFNEPKLDEGDIQELFQMTTDAPGVTFFESVNARDALDKMLRGEVPQRAEIALLQKIFGPDLASELLAKRPFLKKAADLGLEIANIPRSLMSSFDLSAPFRQGIVFISKPRRFGAAFRDMFKYAASEKAYQGLEQSIRARPSFDLMQESGLSITDLGSIGSREERFASNLAEKIPVLGRVVRGSGRAYTGFLTQLRADVFDDLVGKATRLGLKPEEDMALSKSIAGFVNNATGRGDLPGALNGAKDALNALFFSPRLMASRVSLLNPAYYIAQPAFVRKEALKSMLTFASAGASVASIAMLSGAKVETDMRSSDFGKIRYGNTRIDTWGGFQQYVRMAAQLASGEYKSATSGRVRTLGEGYKPVTRYDILLRQIESKEAPIASFVTDMLRQQDYQGNPVDVPTEVADRFTPMVLSDLHELYKDDPSLLPLATLGAFGFGVQNFEKGRVNTNAVLDTFGYERSTRPRPASKRSSAEDNQAKPSWELPSAFVSRPTAASPTVNRTPELQPEAFTKEERKGWSQIAEALDENAAWLKTLSPKTVLPPHLRNAASAEVFTPRDMKNVDERFKRFGGAYGLLPADGTSIEDYIKKHGDLPNTIAFAPGAMTPQGLYHELGHAITRDIPEGVRFEWEDYLEKRLKLGKAARDAAFSAWYSAKEAKPSEEDESLEAEDQRLAGLQELNAKVAPLVPLWLRTNVHDDVYSKDGMVDFETSTGEALAEAFSWYIVAPSLLKRVDPETYKWLNKNVFKGKQYIRRGRQQKE